MSAKSLGITTHMSAESELFNYTFEQLKDRAVGAIIVSLGKDKFVETVRWWITLAVEWGVYHATKERK